MASFTGGDPNHLAVVTADTIDKLLTTVDSLVRPSKVPGLRVVNLFSPIRNETLHIERRPIELSSDGDTAFINVIRPPLYEDRFTHWHAYPTDEGMELHKTKPSETPPEVLERLHEEESAMGVILGALEYARKVRNFKRQIGFSVAYEGETRDLINLINSSRVIE